MDWDKKVELAIAAFAAISGREILGWIVRRYRNRGEISAAAGKIKAETRSIEVRTLSGMVERLDARVISLETELDKSRRNEHECLKRGRDQEQTISQLQREMQKLNFKAAR